MNYIVHGIFQARILERVAVPFSRGFSQPRDPSQVLRVAGRFFTSRATREAQEFWSGWPIPLQGIFPTHCHDSLQEEILRVFPSPHIQFAFLLKTAMAVHTLILVSRSHSSENLGDLMQGTHGVNGRTGPSVFRPLLMLCLGRPVLSSPCALEQRFSKCGGPPASTPLSLGSLLQMQIIMPPPLESAFFFFCLAVRHVGS